MKTVKEVAKELNVHRLTVINMIDRGEIAAVKVGRQWRIEEAELARIKRGK